MNFGCAVGIIPIVGPEFTKVRINENPLLKVPPASRGNRTRARFPSRSGGNLQEGGTIHVGLTQLSTAIRRQRLPTPAEKLWATA